MKCYISGKIADLPYECVVEKFAQAAAQVKAYGHEPVNPLDNGLDASEPWNKHIVADIAMMLECDAIYLLTDHVNSRGARIELNIAMECGLKILHQPAYASYLTN